MNRLLILSAAIALATGCYVGDTEDALHILSLRQIQPDPTKSTCDTTLIAFDAIADTVPNLNARHVAGKSELLTYFISSDVQPAIPEGFDTNPNLQGLHHNDFLADTIVLEYSSDSISLPTERIPTFIRIGEGATGTDSCAQAEIIGPDAQGTLGNLVLVDPIIVKIKTHLEGSYVNGKLSKTASVVIPLTVYKN